MKTKYLITEPLLNPPEPVDFKAIVRRRDQMQEYTYEQYTYDQERLQEEINTWRMNDAREDALLEQEGK